MTKKSKHTWTRHDHKIVLETILDKHMTVDPFLIKRLLAKKVSVPSASIDFYLNHLRYECTNSSKGISGAASMLLSEFRIFLDKYGMTKDYFGLIVEKFFV